MKKTGIRLLFLWAAMAAVLWASVISASAMVLLVDINDGVDILTMEVEPNDSIDYMKAKIYELRGIAPVHQHLTYNGNRLEDGKTLSDYGIQKESTIYVIVDEHVFSDCTDTECDVDMCGYTRAAEAHSFTDCTDATCNGRGCSFVREAAAEHKFSSCLDTVCGNDGCTLTRLPLTHTFGVWNEYNESLHIRTCSACGADETAAHELGEWRTDLEPTITKAGSRSRVCQCGYSVSEELPKKPMPTAAIVGIAVAALALVGGGTFLIYRFGTKKKAAETEADDNNRVG